MINRHSSSRTTDGTTQVRRVLEAGVPTEELEEDEGGEIDEEMVGGDGKFLRAVTITRSAEVGDLGVTL